jgi:signal transduction histidine kinase/CheY-like chemotaxis protein
MNSSAGQGYHILVVDDETIVLSLVRDALEDENYVIETSSSSQDALVLVQREPFDLLITDIRMPHMDGIELVRRVREVQPDIAIIFMTGYANLASAKNAIKQGASDYIMKPFELVEIRQAVKNALKLRSDSVDKSATQQLAHLSDLNQMLFTANDRTSLIVSSLRFAMMHMRTARGALLHWDLRKHYCLLLSVSDAGSAEMSLPDAPLLALNTQELTQPREPFLADCGDYRPFSSAPLPPELNQYFCPSWLEPGKRMIVVPVMRSEAMHGWMMLGFEDDSERIREADSKFLAITASQLAITIENLGLLEESQQAYARLKALQDQTIELEKMATRGQMSAEIGHELNNFLGVVAGNLSLLDVQLRRGKYDDLGRYVTAMTETIEKIKRFTGSLMDLKQISSKVETLQFDKVLREVLDYLKPQRRYTGVTMEVHELPEDIPFLGDNVQIQQLLYNLFNNAADAVVDRPEKKITVDLAMTSEGEEFALEIRDTGIGFQTDLLTKAFKEQFTTKKTGHGFGLVVCKRIIDNHSGRLTINSHPDEGTCIRIDFPVARPELAAV